MKTDRAGPAAWLAVNSRPAAATPAPGGVPCALCRARTAAAGYRTCQPCSGRVEQLLRDLGLLYRHAVAGPGASSPTARGAGGPRMPGPASPTSDARLVLTDRRPVDDGGRGDVHGVLSEWVDEVRLARGLQPRRLTAHCRTAQRLALGTVAGELAQLRVHWPWCRRQVRVVRLVAALDALYARIRAVAGETPGQVRIGHCPTVVDDVRCGRLLLARPGDREVRCPACATPWPRSRWLDLRDRVRA